MRLLMALSALIFGFTGMVRAETLVFATDWRAQAEHGGFYQALATGLYEKAGLTVRLRPGGPQTDIPRLMAAGAVDIGMASNAFQPFNLAAAGADIKVLMAIFQKDPQVLMVHPDDDATGFADLKGRSIFVADSALATFWPWLKSQYGYEDHQIRKYSYSLAPWLVNPGSVQEGYVSSEPFIAREAGIMPKVFLFADAGYQGYAAMVMARSDFVASKAESVAAFITATRLGWRSYLWDDPTPANILIKKDNAEMTDTVIAYSRATMLAHEMLGSPEAIGCMSKDRWRRFQDEMSALGLVSPDVDVETIIDTRFLDGCGGPP